jgi:hypothetical protein
VLGCMLARERRARVVTRVTANTNSTVWCHKSEQHGATHDGEKDRLSQKGMRALMKAAAPASDLTHPGTMAGITSGGGAAARCGGTFPLGSKAGASTRAGKCPSSPWWPRGSSAGVGEVRWRGSSAGRKTKATAARHRGS